MSHSPLPARLCRAPADLVFVCVVALALLLAALAARAAGSAIEVRQAWLRPTVAGQDVGGGYFVIVNRGPDKDRLVGVRSPVAERVELHEMSMDGDVMRMRQVDGLDVPAGATVALQPGGYHLMLMGLKRPLAAGQSVPLTLRFAHAGELTVQAKVSQSAPSR